MFKDWLAGASTGGWVGFGGDAGGGLLAEPDVAEVRYWNTAETGRATSWAAFD
jgi:hypothetical protein